MSDFKVTPHSRRKTSPVRVAQVVHALEIGGSEVLAWRIARVLNQGGQHLCSMNAVHGSGILAGVLAAEGIAAKAFSKNRRFDLGLILRLAAHFRSARVQVLHTHHLGQLLYGGLAGRLAGARVVHTEHDSHTLSRRRHQFLLRRLAAIADAVTAVAESITDFLRVQVGIPAQKLSTVANGVDIARFSTAHPLDRSTWGWSDEHVVVGCVARLEKEKGHAMLLDAFRRVHSRHPSLKLLLVGDGSERAALEQFTRQHGVKESVAFLGARTDVPELMAACDIVALTSVREGLPISILEAMAASKAVVATKVGGVPQIVVDNVTGLLVEPSDAEALARALEHLMLDHKARRRLGSEAYDLVRTRYSFDHTVTQYARLYDSILADDGVQSPIGWMVKGFSRCRPAPKELS